MITFSAGAWGWSIASLECLNWLFIQWKTFKSNISLQIRVHPEYKTVGPSEKARTNQNTKEVMQKSEKLKGILRSKYEKEYKLWQKEEEKKRELLEQQEQLRLVRIQNLKFNQIFSKRRNAYIHHYHYNISKMQELASFLFKLYALILFWIEFLQGCSFLEKECKKFNSYLDYQLFIIYLNYSMCHIKLYIDWKMSWCESKSSAL